MQQAPRDELRERFFVHGFDPKTVFVVYSPVDDFVAAGAHEFNRIQQRSRSAHKDFNANHLQTTKLREFQQAPESGSGPGGRRFKSSLPDHLFQALKP
jgi:hypothetical protein